MVLMNEQALEAQGVSVLGVRRKMFKTFEVIRRKMIRRPWRTAGGELVALWWRCRTRGPVGPKFVSAVGSSPTAGNNGCAKKDEDFD